MKPKVVEENLVEKVVKHLSPDQVIRKLEELSQVEPGQLSLLAQVHKWLRCNLSVSRSFSLFDPKLLPLVLGVLEGLFNATGPAAKEELSEDGMEVANDGDGCKVAFPYGRLQLMVRPSPHHASFRFNLDEKPTKLPPDLEQQDRVDSPHLWQLTLVEGRQRPGKSSPFQPKSHLSSRDNTSSSSVSEIPLLAAVM